MEKYIISKHYRVDAFDTHFNLDDSAGETPIEIRQAIESYAGEYILINEADRSVYLLNATIKLFLDFFVEPVGLDSVIENFATMANCEAQVIEPTMQAFFEAMTQRRVIVKEGAVQTLIAETPLFQKESLVLDYLVIEELDTKGKREIYLAKDLRSGKEVVLKILSPEKSRDEMKFRQDAELLKQEYLFLQKIGHHKRVCKVYDFGSIKPGVAVPVKPGVAAPDTESELDPVYIAMEHIRGQVLSDFFIVRDSALDTKLKLISGILEVFSFIHEKDILHGDIHASNFMVTEGEEVKIIDFGFANNRQPRQDEIINIGGVPYYMPPERLLDDSFEMFSKPADFESEVYQLGIVLYYVLYERMPFSGFTWQALVAAIKNNHTGFDEITKQGEPIPAPVIDFLKKALNKDPGDRYPSADTMYRQWINI
ncbi:MAG: serine/threonine protein kinase [bacterium]|nr:serine/threonine protein kinase [bacterium]